MINRFWSGLLTLLLLSGCGWNGTPTRPNDFTKLTSITISAVSPVIANGTSTKLIATGYYSGQFSRDVTDQVAWSSALPAVADFGTAAPNKNRVFAVLFGATDTLNKTVVITATVEGVTSAPFTLTVSPATVTEMTINPIAPDKLPKGRSLQLAVSGKFSDLSTQDLTFDAAWSSNDKAVVTVSDVTASKGLARAEAAVGSANIVAVFPPIGGTVSGKIILTVTDPVLDSITVTPSDSSTVGYSKSVTFAAKGTYSDGTTKDITTATWSSSVPGVATIIASSGVATTVAAGTTVISATLGLIKGSTNLTVTAPVLNANGLQITPANPTLTFGAVQQLVLTATFNDGSTQNVASSGIWTSTFPSIASVGTNTGSVTAGNVVSATTITAQYGGQSASTIVSVQ